MGLGVGGWVQGVDLRSAVSFQVPRSHCPLQGELADLLAFLGFWVLVGWLIRWVWLDGFNFMGWGLFLRCRWAGVLIWGDKLRLGFEH